MVRASAHSDGGQRLGDLNGWSAWSFKWVVSFFTPIVSAATLGVAGFCLAGVVSNAKSIAVHGNQISELKATDQRREAQVGALQSTVGAVPEYLTRQIDKLERGQESLRHELQSLRVELLRRLNNDKD